MGNLIQLFLYFSFCFGDTNTLSTATGVVDASELNQFRSALNSTFMPRNSSGVVADLAASLGSSTYRFDSSHIQKIFLGTASQNVFIDGSGADLRFYVSNTKEASVTTNGVEGSYLKDGSVTQGGLNNGNYSFGSLDSGPFNTTSTTYTQVTNLSATITTTGRPVIAEIGASSGDTCNIQFGGNLQFDLAFKMDGTIYSEATMFHGNVLVYPCGGFYAFNVPSAGLHTFTVWVKTNTSNISVYNAVLNVWEM